VLVRTECRLHYSSMMALQNTHEKEFLLHELRKFEDNPTIQTSINYPPTHPHPWSSCPAILFWNPSTAYSLSLDCGTCESSQLAFKGLWSSDSASKYRPRLLFNFGRNVKLVSAEYHCETCDKSVLAHSEEVLKQCPKSIDPGFILFHRCGVTQTAYNMIISGVIEGEKNF
jgi:hypothetical protein